MPSVQDMFSQAMGLYSAGRPAESWPLLVEILRSRPDHDQARELLMGIAMQTARHEEALPVLRDAAADKRSVAELQEAIGLLLMQGGKRLDEAEQHFKRALAIQPGRAPSVMMMGVIMVERGRLAEANQFFERACQLDPSSVLAWFNRGMYLFWSERFLDAAGALKRAVALTPRDAVMLTWLGRALHRSDRMTEAMATLRKAAAMLPDHPIVLSNLGNALVSIGQTEEGCALLSRALALDPREGDPRLLALNYVSDDGEQLLEDHRAFAAMLESAVPELPAPARPRDPERPLRIGFLSGDLREHSCAYFLAPLFDGLPAEGFEVVGLSNSFREDAITVRFKRAATDWVSLAGRKTLDAANAVREAGIDVLIDCSGHTEGQRLDICAARPAPVQMTFLGYPNTTGLTRIDYRLVDAITDPAPAADRHATESLLRIPECLWCFRAADGAPPVGPSPAAIAGHVTIGCFNNLSKITPEVIGAYAEVLRRAPRARLLFKNRRVEEPETMAWLRNQFVELGISGDRVEAMPWIAKASDHLKVYDQIDFQLDTFPYNGTTTTCESFWQGVPIVAVKGRVHAGRVSMSLLHAVGLDELVADDMEGYIRIAAELANDPERTARLRAGMRDRMERSPLRDEPGYCRRFGGVVRQAWRTACERAHNSGSVAR